MTQEFLGSRSLQSHLVHPSVLKKRQSSTTCYLQQPMGEQGMQK